MLFFVILLLPTVAHGVPKEFKFIETKDVVRIDHLYSRMQKLAESFKGKVGEDIIKRKCEELKATCTTECDDEVRSLKYIIFFCLKKPTLEECKLECLKRGLMGIEESYVCDLKKVYVN
ncbi:hypothetical protein M514_00651 [Trichuris suis]|uniref:Chondroitin proteoglycan 4 domain-containing protein n=1 Tax=Trichuris suis TaxID=68888 RepID=A0A085N719_9BILA|nr:hypothetical protein M513_00651 [Trichuris suis]KFD65265.1 hypothetical protein M514_00651 [Trichuris suis]